MVQEGAVGHIRPTRKSVDLPGRGYMFGHCVLVRQEGTAVGFALRVGHDTEENGRILRKR